MESAAEAFALAASWSLYLSERWTTLEGGAYHSGPEQVGQYEDRVVSGGEGWAFKCDEFGVPRFWRRG